MQICKFATYAQGGHNPRRIISQLNLNLSLLFEVLGMGAGIDLPRQCFVASYDNVDADGVCIIRLSLDHPCSFPFLIDVIWKALLMMSSITTIR